MFVRNTSAPSTNSNARATPSSVPRSSTTLRFERLSSSNGGLVGRSPPSIRWNVRAGSPVGGSILTTSAPQSARMPPAPGPATHTPSSTTRTPASGPVALVVMAANLFAQRRSEHRHARDELVAVRGLVDHHLLGVETAREDRRREELEAVAL